MAGDIFAAGTITKSVSDADLVMLKLAGGTGTVLWRGDSDGSKVNSFFDVPKALALDGGAIPAIAGGSIAHAADGAGAIGEIGAAQDRLARS